MLVTASTDGNRLTASTGLIVLLPECFQGGAFISPSTNKMNERRLQNDKYKVRHQSDGSLNAPALKPPASRQSHDGFMDSDLRLDVIPTI